MKLLCNLSDDHHPAPTFTPPGKKKTQSHLKIVSAHILYLTLFACFVLISSILSNTIWTPPELPKRLHVRGVTAGKLFEHKTNKQKKFIHNSNYSNISPCFSFLVFLFYVLFKFLYFRLIQAKKWFVFFITIQRIKRIFHYVFEFFFSTHHTHTHPLSILFHRFCSYTQNPFWHFCKWNLK